MFKLANTIDIASEMESNLYKATHEEESHVDRKRIEAARQLSVAATAFEQAGLFKFAEASTIIVERILNSKIQKTAGINNPDYTHYVLVNGKIESGWEYPEDAKDNAREILEFQPRNAVKIYSLRHLNKIGLDPDDDANWHAQQNDILASDSGDSDFEYPEAAKHIRLQPKEISRADNGITIIVRPQSEGGYMIAAVRIEGESGVLLGRAFTEYVDDKNEIAGAAKEVARWLSKMNIGEMGDASRHRNNDSNDVIISEAAKKKPVGKKVKKPKNPGKSKDEKEMYRYIGYDANNIEDSPHGNAGRKGMYYGNAHLPSVYNKTHEGPGEWMREQLESGLTETPNLQSGPSDALEDRFLDMILGDKGEVPEEEIDQIAENNEADDINMINELFEDV